jgi:hypothetical protein
MADLKPLAGLSLDETLQMVVFLLSQVVEKLPRIDAADRVITSGGEVEALSLISSIGSSGRGRPTDFLPVVLPNAGAMHIYNNIVVSS